MLLEELPPVLVLHLKWFTYDKNGGLQKCIKQVDFDIDLEIGKGSYCSSSIFHLLCTGPTKFFAEENVVDEFLD